MKEEEVAGSATNANGQCGSIKEYLAVISLTKGFSRSAGETIGSIQIQRVTKIIQKYLVLGL